MVSLAFFSGLVVTLVGLGTAAALAGRLLRRWEAGFTAGMAVISLVAGLAGLWGRLFPRRHRPPRLAASVELPAAFVAGGVYSFAALVTSAGPLTLLLAASAAIGRAAYGAALSFAYALGRGLPFVGIGLFAETAARWAGRLHRAQRPVELVGGLMLVAAGLYFGWAAYSMARPNGRAAGSRALHTNIAARPPRYPVVRPRRGHTRRERPVAGFVVHTGRERIGGAGGPGEPSR